jgi:hypothetical protein
MQTPARSSACIAHWEMHHGARTFPIVIASRAAAETHLVRKVISGNEASRMEYPLIPRRQTSINASCMSASGHERKSFCDAGGSKAQYTTASSGGALALFNANDVVRVRLLILRRLTVIAPRLVALGDRALYTITTRDIDKGKSFRGVAHQTVENRSQ